MSRFLKFEEVQKSASKKTTIWAVKNLKSDFVVGAIVWCAAWRKYVFEPADNCIFDTECLTSIIEFISLAMHEHKNGKTTDSEKILTTPDRNFLI